MTKEHQPVREPSRFKVNQDWPHRQLADINFYQYPPPKPATLAEKLSLAEKLALDQSVAGDSLFTIFVSIPYCRSQCYSCRFFKRLLPFHVDRYGLLNDYLDCLDIQIKKYAATVRFSSAHCGALYIGGGTATLLAPDQVDRLIYTISESFAMDPNVEITLEGNPREFTREYLQQVKESGVTRVSIGVQSYRHTILRKTLNFPHDGNASWEAVRNAVAVGFDTVNVDLLYRLPGQTIEHWHYDLQTTLDFEPDNTTIYSYVVYPGSAAEELIARGYLRQPIDLDTAHEWYLWASKELEQRGYDEQGKGKFCKPGHPQRYRVLSYKNCCEIIGLGAGAYSFINGYQFNVSGEAGIYEKQVCSGLFPVVDNLSVQATKRNIMERYVIFNYLFSSLNRQDFYHRFGQDPLTVFPNIFSKLEKYNLVAINDQEIKLTDLGKKWVRNILYDFYSDTFK